jgi:hypothetical protein
VGRTAAGGGPAGPRGYAFVVVSLRYLIIGGWAAAVVAAIVFLPPLTASAGGLSELIPPVSAIGSKPVRPGLERSG